MESPLGFHAFTSPMTAAVGSSVAQIAQRFVAGFPLWRMSAEIPLKMPVN
jgi:hypothetical protein